MLFFYTEIFNVDFPASCQYALACGGTTLTCPTYKYTDEATKEIVWGTNVDSNEGGGGGYSSIFTPLPYQEALGLTKRGVPDVCGVADPATGWIIYLNGKYNVYGGTSAVAPMWAAYLSLLGIKSFIIPTIYASQVNSGLHDILLGNNHGYNATKGWDPASGLGSPNGTILNALLH